MLLISTLLLHASADFRLLQVFHSGHSPGTARPYVLHQQIASRTAYTLNSVTQLVAQIRNGKVIHTKQDIPNMSDPLTVLNFAKMTYNSYYEPNSGSWKVVPGWNVTAGFGWDSSVGIRGYLYQDLENGALVIVMKGTSLATPVSGGPTAVADKLNDNMVCFSTVIL